ncbi:MAG: isocitrate lyase/PEP mutase family protein [Dehalococcoidales bacterium]|nr:isocitrate lyase/PEP mutase family protein [Dehalococcoidales bacterium]MDZ4230377.1 isocitrate lyase/PEP mutase family protein [Dehalococcoidales bacterium]
MDNSAKLREMMDRQMVVAPFCLNAYHGKIAQLVGFGAVYMTGWGTAAERGFPDVGLITQTEIVQNARYIVNAVDVPVICDADTGYGNPINVWRTVREYEAAGAAAIHIEDQVFPKKCGFFAGKQVIPMEDYIPKLKAALDARRNKEFVIIARCDALAINGWEDTIRRCRAYHEAGADAVFVDGVKSREDLEIYARELRDLPRLFNGGQHLAVTTEEAARLGFKIMITGGTNLVVYGAVKRAFRELKENGVVPPEMLGNLDEALDMLGLPEIYAMEKRYKVT